MYRSTQPGRGGEQRQPPEAAVSCPVDYSRLLAIPGSLIAGKSQPRDRRHKSANHWHDTSEMTLHPRRKNGSSPVVRRRPQPACDILTRLLSYPHILWPQPDYLPNIELFRWARVKSGPPHRLTVTDYLHQNASPEPDPTCRDKFSTTTPGGPPGDRICASALSRLD